MTPPDYDPRGNLFSLEEAAERLHLSPSTLRTYHKRGEIPFVRLGHHFYVAESDLIEFIDKHRERKEPQA